VFHPAVGRVELGKFLLRHMKAIACTVEQDRPGTGRALVNGKQLRGFCHQANSVTLEKVQYQT